MQSRHKAWCILVALAILILAGSAAAAPATGASLGQQPGSDKTETIRGINESLEQIPWILRAILLGDNTINITVSTHDGSQLAVHIITQDGKVKDFGSGTLENPTFELWTSEITVLGILESEEPLLAAQKAFADGRIGYKTTNIVLWVTMALLYIINWVALLVLGILGFVFSLIGGG